MSRISNGVLAIVLSFLVVAGCAASPKVVRTYDGAPRPPTEIAIVHAKRNGIFAGGALSGYALDVAAIEVDGNAVPIGDWVWQAPPDIELEPGSHTLTLVIDQDGAIRAADPPQATFAAEAGRTYELRGRQAETPAKPGRVEAHTLEWWIVDMRTGVTVASNVADSPPR